MPKKLTIEDCHKLAKERGGRFLSTEYINNKTKYEWQCSKGHKWMTAYYNVTTGHWCPDCNGNPKITIKDCLFVAESKCGKFLSTEYINAHAKYTWECSKGHQWEASFDAVKRMSWCPYCAGRPIIKLDDCQKVAEERGGKFLSTEYINNKTKYEWQCSKGHRWLAVFDAIANGKHWCPYCSGRTGITAKYCQKVAESKGGKFLSTEYIDSKTKYEWECAEGHRWMAILSNIKLNKGWCPECAGNMKSSIKDCLFVAESKGGKFLSTEYVNAHAKCEWECSDGHQWKASYNSIFRGTWCPKCVDNRRSQNELAEFCKTINSNFIENARPFDGTKLELDIYYPELKKAIELDGDYWHSMPGGSQRDSRKNKLCEEYGIELLRISYEKQWHKKASSLGRQLIVDFLTS